MHFHVSVIHRHVEIKDIAILLSDVVDATRQTPSTANSVDPAAADIAPSTEEMFLCTL